MPNTPPPSDLLSLLLSSITKTPRHFLFFVLLVIGLITSVQALLIALLVLVFLLIVRCPWWVMGVLGLLSVSLTWLIDGTSPLLLFHWNIDLFNSWLSGEEGRHDLTFYDWLVALPYGLLLGWLLWLVTRLTPKLEQELKRVGKGRSLKAKRLSKKQLSRRLNNIKQAAYDEGSILGVNQQSGSVVALSDQDANLHTLAVATTGAGKTTVY